MFREFDCGRITVPACERHNSNKNIDDRAFVTWVVRAAYALWKRYPASSTLTPNVLKTVRAVESQFGQAKREVTLRPLLKDTLGVLRVPLKESDWQLPYIAPRVQPRAWIRQLTAALVWSAIGEHDPTINWDAAWAWSPDFFPGNVSVEVTEAARTILEHRHIQETLDVLPWSCGWSSIPRYPEDIYSFDVVFLDDPQQWPDKRAAFRHRFYNGTSTWYCLF